MVTSSFKGSYGNKSPKIPFKGWVSEGNFETNPDLSWVNQVPLNMFLFIGHTFQPCTQVKQINHVSLP